MLLSLFPSVVLLASLSACVSADVNLNSFPDVVHVNQSYTLSWTATTNYSYTIWLVVPDADSPGNPYDWKKKIEGLETGAHYESLSPSYTFNVPSNISTSGIFALWIDAFPIPYDGTVVTNITEPFTISSSPSSATSGTSSSTPSATASATSSATHTSGATDQIPSSGHHSGISGGAIAGIVIGLLVAIAIVVAAVLLARRRKLSAGVKEREAQARANRLAPVMQSPAAIEMHGRNAELAKETNV